MSRVSKDKFDYHVTGRYIKDIDYDFEGVYINFEDDTTAYILLVEINRGYDSITQAEYYINE